PRRARNRSELRRREAQSGDGPRFAALTGQDGRNGRNGEAGSAGGAERARWTGQARMADGQNGMGGPPALLALPAPPPPPALPAPPPPPALPAPPPPPALPALPCPTTCSEAPGR